MRVRVYNGSPFHDHFTLDSSELTGDTWEEVLDEFRASWYFEKGEAVRFVLVAIEGGVGDHVRIVTAKPGVVLEAC